MCDELELSPQRLNMRMNFSKSRQKANRNVFVIRRMEKLGLNSFTLVDYCKKEVRVHLELAVHVWHSGLSKKYSQDIERVQCVAVNIIMDNDMFPYDQDKALNQYQLGARSCVKSLQKRLHLKITDTVTCFNWRRVAVIIPGVEMRNIKNINFLRNTLVCIQTFTVVPYQPNSQNYVL